MLRRNSYIDYYGPMDQNYVVRPEFYRIHLGMPTFARYIADVPVAHLVA